MDNSTIKFHYAVISELWLWLRKHLPMMDHRPSDEEWEELITSAKKFADKFNNNQLARGCIVTAMEYIEDTVKRRFPIDDN